MPDTDQESFKQVYDLGWRDGRVSGIYQLMAYLQMMHGKTLPIGRTEVFAACREMLDIWRDEVKNEYR